MHVKYFVTNTCNIQSSQKITSQLLVFKNLNDVRNGFTPVKSLICPAVQTHNATCNADG